MKFLIIESNEGYAYEFRDYLMLLPEKGKFYFDCCKQGNGTFHIDSPIDAENETSIVLEALDLNVDKEAIDILRSHFQLDYEHKILFPVEE